MAKTKLLGNEKQKQLKEQKKIAKQKNKKHRKGPIGFFKDVGGELKKTTWPTGKELMKTVLAVIIFIVIFVAIVWAIDLGLGQVFQFVVVS